MATGYELPILYGGADGGSAAADTPKLLGGNNDRCRLAVAWLYPSSTTFTTPAGWLKLYDQVLGLFRCGVFFTAENDINSVADVAFSATSCLNAINGAGWRGVHAQDPLAVTPVTVNSTGAVTSQVIPAMTLPPGTVPLWFWAARYSGSASGKAITLPGDLTSSGNITVSTTPGLIARCGAWTRGTAAPTNQGVGHPAGTTGTKTATITATTAGAAGIGFAIRPVDLGGHFGMA